MPLVGEDDGSGFPGSPGQKWKYNARNCGSLLNNASVDAYCSSCRTLLY
jgi:hypothetical protein